MECQHLKERPRSPTQDTPSLMVNEVHFPVRPPSIAAQYFAGGSSEGMGLAQLAADG